MPDEVTLHTAEAARLPAINMTGYSPAQHALGSCGNWTALTFPSVIASSGAISGKWFPQPKQHIKSAVVGLADVSGWLHVGHNVPGFSVNCASSCL